MVLQQPRAGQSGFLVCLTKSKRKHLQQLKLLQTSNIAMNPATEVTPTLPIVDRMSRCDERMIENYPASNESEPHSSHLPILVPHLARKPCKAATLLPEDWGPSGKDVILGRGRNIWNHIGNMMFRLKVQSKVDEYSKARTKLDKSTILSSIVADIRAGSPKGGFVRKDPKTGRWCEVSLARASFRTLTQQ
jgi:hypothetical protein